MSLPRCDCGRVLGLCWRCLDRVIEGAPVNADAETRLRREVEVAASAPVIAVALSTGALLAALAVLALIAGEGCGGRGQAPCPPRAAALDRGSAPGAGDRCVVTEPTRKVAP